MPTRILIADDNAIVRGALRQVLENEGQGDWEITDAENGDDAVMLAQQIKPALVILDLAMPLKDGLRTAREMQRSLPGTPIVLHTLYSSPRVAIEAMKAGIRKTIPKSESGVLVAAVRDLLKQSAMEKTVEAKVVQELSSQLSNSSVVAPEESIDERTNPSRKAKDEPKGLQTKAS